MSEEIKLKRRRTIFMVLMIVFAAISFAVKGSSEEGIQFFMWRDQPVIAAICILLALVMGISWWRAGKQLLTVKIKGEAV